MSRVKSLVQMLQACEKYDFDKVVKSYLKEIYNFDRVVITDGKNDTGIDIKVFDIGTQKIQYQMTVQKSDNASRAAQLKIKIFEDVAKAKDNADNYGWSENLYFFYSHELTNKVMRDYKNEALRSYNIHLEIIDANQIAEESESYLNLQKTIYDTSGLNEFKEKQSLAESKEESLIYDMISFGSSADVKLSIVETFIFTILYASTPLSQAEIVHQCMDKFKSKENPHFYDKLIQKLYSTKHDLSYDKVTRKYSLSKEKEKRIELSIEQIKLDEQLFLTQISEVLKVYESEADLAEYVKLLRQFYIDNFSKRIKDSEYNTTLEANELKSFAEKKVGIANAKSLMMGLFEVCDNNSYLQQICASDIYSSKINIDHLQRHAKQSKFVFVDTTIALYLLCRFSENAKSYNSYYYNLSSHLFDFCQRTNVKLNITNRYLWEVGNHIKEAFNLIPFTNLPNFNLLGSSKNVFYNFYLYLKDSHGETMSFSEYMNYFNFSAFDNQQNNKYIELYLSEMGIGVIDIPKTYNIDNSIKIIGGHLSEKSKFKSKFALDNDAIMLEYLGDKDVDVHPIDPVFITWDRTLFAVLNEFFKKNPNAQRWMQFTPSQFIDKYSLLSFSVNETTITKEMLAILSGDIVNQTHSLLDSLALILNPNNEVGLEYTNRFIKMKDEKIFTTTKKSDEPQEDGVINILDQIIYKITSYYRDEPEKNIGLKILLSEKSDIDKIMRLISDAYDFYEKNNRFDDELLKILDKMISEILSSSK